MNGSKHEIDAIPAGNSAGTLSTCCSLLFSLCPSFSLDLRGSSPAALIVFLIRTRWDGIMYTFNYSDTSATRDTPPPQTRHPDFIIVSVSPVILIGLFLCDALLNLFACKFIRPFLSRILYPGEVSYLMQRWRHCMELLKLHGSNFFPKLFCTSNKNNFN